MGTQDVACIQTILVPDDRTTAEIRAELDQDSTGARDACPGMADHTGSDTGAPA
jgi:hypothetical protein